MLSYIGKGGDSMIPTDGNMRKAHHAFSLAMRLHKVKASKKEALLQIKNQYMLDDEQTHVVWYAAQLARQKGNGYQSYDEAIRDARQADLKVEHIRDKHTVQREETEKKAQKAERETKKANKKKQKQES